MPTLIFLIVLPLLVIGRRSRAEQPVPYYGSG